MDIQQALIDNTSIFQDGDLGWMHPYSFAYDAYGDEDDLYGGQHICWREETYIQAYNANEQIS